VAISACRSSASADYQADNGQLTEFSLFLSLSLFFFFWASPLCKNLPFQADFATRGVLIEHRLLLYKRDFGFFGFYLIQI
jgi:hypothetical protein